MAAMCVGGRWEGEGCNSWRLGAAGAASPPFSTHTYTLDLNNIDGLLGSAFFVSTGI